MKQIPEQYQPIREVAESLGRYVEHGGPTGDFLRAVLENNLRESFERADPFNQVRLHLIVRYCYNHIPMACWGSPEKVAAWLDFKRQQREMEQVNQRITT